MELELRQDYISCWDKGYHRIINQEETLEMIVPDACPDILQILDGEGKLLLQRKEPMDGRAEFSGSIKVTVLYQPDGVGNACSMEAILPLSTATESPAITRRSKLMVNPQIQKIEVHLLNPRKVLIKVNFTLDVQCFTAQNISVCSCVENCEKYAVKQKTEEYQSYMTVAVLEKMFNYSDVLTLPAGRPDMKELLRTRADCSCNESKVIGNKVVLKGEAKLDLLYRSLDDRLCSALFQLPFSQIIECNDPGEETVPEIRIIYTDLSCKPNDEGGRNLSVELELLAQGFLRKIESSSILTDLYSTGYEVTPIQTEYPVCLKMDQGVAPESVREVLETGVSVEDILDIQVRPASLATSKQGNELAMNAEVEVFVLFMTEQGSISSVHRRFIVAHHIPISDLWQYSSDFWISREGSASPVSGGIEVSFTLEFGWNAMETGAIQGIERVRLEENKANAKECPSVIIRSVRARESLWDIAKAYVTTEEEIAEANSLSTMELYPGQMLIIPRLKEKILAE
ncbi:MAG: peptidoglycan-binding protein LysM [Bacillota bacterium]|jgi:hypothetical protein|nr:peptidoglycan-binding protein LysM [Bacillota bacterium]